jgi:RimJ/RimL family protein N-acetyltransferase
MKLVIPTLEDCEQTRKWRNESLVVLRTPYELTEEMQEDFYKNVICNRNSPHRYWSLNSKIEISGADVPVDEMEIANLLMAFGGLTFIEWENRLARISLIVNPDYQREGYGEEAVGLILDKAFNYLNLQTVCGECYKCNPAVKFWDKIIDKYGAYTTLLPNRKYWKGRYWDSVYFSIDKNDYIQVK